MDYAKIGDCGLWIGCLVTVLAATLETRGGAPSTTSLWILIFMILLFNGSFVCAPLFPLPPVLLPALTSFQFCYRCVYIFQLLSSAAAPTALFTRSVASLA